MRQKIPAAYEAHTFFIVSSCFSFSSVLRLPLTHSMATLTSWHAYYNGTYIYSSLDEDRNGIDRKIVIIKCNLKQAKAFKKSI